VVLLARLIISAKENDRLLEALHGEAATDPLTGLANRRKLFDDLDALFADQSKRPAGHVFALFDLDGFKAYNDAFGHPAGDALLQRLGGMLQLCVSTTGRAYRLGGDEFCILCELGGRSPASIARLAAEALRESGEGFSITASYGVVELPHETEDPSEALRIADSRMYADKGDSASRANRQTHDVLIGVLREREPSLGPHLEGVARLSIETARELGLNAEDIDTIGRAAELHDIGKIAIPDSVLNKAGPLDDDEWKLMHRHTLIGQRILGAAPALRPVGKLVRSSHERWDGGGYPDGLAGKGIPLGSRIILVCDAYDAMTSSRPYQAAIPVPAVLEELRRHAGSQFDPEVVESFCKVVELLEGEKLEAPGAFERWATDLSHAELA
jgi:two-component system cell cycle response regulator